MDSQHLYRVLPFLEDVNTEKKLQFEEYFKNAPLWVLDSLRVEVYEPGQIITQENEKADTIYFVGNGKIKATDYRVSGIAYDFMKPISLIALGGMETIMELDIYRATIQAQTKCTVVKLSRKQYEKWIYSDLETFRLEAKLTCTSLLEEERRNRLFLFLKGSDRLGMLFVELYEKYNKNGQLSIKESRQELADATGLCVKSISRAIKQLMENGLITKKGNLILIKRKQYEKLRVFIDEKLMND